jgi:hypothetical protein
MNVDTSDPRHLEFWKQTSECMPDWEQDKDLLIREKNHAGNIAVRAVKR